MIAIPSNSIPVAEKSSANAIEVALKTAQAIWWSTGQQLATNVVTFGGYIVLARLLPPKDFGLFAFASVFTVLLQTFTDQGIPDAVVQRAKLEKAHIDTAFWFNMVLSFVLAGIASRRGGLPEIAQHGVNGWLFEPDEKQSLTQLLRTLSPKICRSFHEACLQRSRAFLPEVITAQ